MRVIPYVEVNGVRSMSDDYLMGMFRLMQKEGTAKRVFHNGGVQSEQQFIKWMKEPGFFSMVIVDDESSPLLLSWVNGIEENRGWYNFCVFKKAWGNISIEVGKASVEYWLSMRDSKGNPVFHVLMGATPTNNRLAIQYIKKCGAQPIGVIPSFGRNYWTGKRWDAMFSYIEGRK
jgi:hypothetical protein